MARPQARTRQRVTIKDVAEAAGVSVSTVSNALNGRDTAMAGETLARVRHAIDVLKYRRSSLARGLATRHSKTIGLLMAEIETPLFLQALHYVEPRARSRRYDLLLSVASDPAEERQALEFLLDKQAEGFIFISTSTLVDESHLEELYARGVPVVLVNRASRNAAFDQINWDNSGGVTSAVNHLAALGHRRIAHLLGPAVRVSTVERHSGYRAGLAANGLPFDERYVLDGDYTAGPAGWEDTARRLLALEPRPTAVIASDDVVAATLIRTWQRAGVSVPGDIAVVGVDNQPFASYLNPALTTVQLPVAQAGQMAVEMLLERLDGRRTDARHVVLPCDLIVRESCGAGLSA